MAKRRHRKGGKRRGRRGGHAMVVSSMSPFGEGGGARKGGAGANIGDILKGLGGMYMQHTFGVNPFNLGFGM